MATVSSSSTTAGSSSPTAAAAAASSSPTAAAAGSSPTAPAAAAAAAGELGIIPRTESNRGQGDFLAALLICLFESIEGLESFLNTIRHDTHHLNEFCLLCCLKTISSEPPSEAIKFHFFFRICEDFDREFSTIKKLLEFVIRDFHFWSEGGTWKDFMSSPLFHMFGFSSTSNVKGKMHVLGIIYKKAEIKLMECLCQLEIQPPELNTEISTTLTDLSDCFIACDFNTYTEWLDLDYMTLDFKDKYLVNVIIVMVDNSPAIYLRCQQNCKRILRKEGILQITTLSLSELCDKPAIIVFYRRMVSPLPLEKYNTHPPEKYEETKEAPNEIPSRRKLKREPSQSSKKTKAGTICY